MGAGVEKVYLLKQIHCFTYARVMYRGGPEAHDSLDISVLIVSERGNAPKHRLLLSNMVSLIVAYPTILHIKRQRAYG